MPLYYQDDNVTLYHGDCLTEHREWLDADVLVTDPPYGIAWSKGAWSKAKRTAGTPGIQNDDDTSARDEVLANWGTKPALVFASLRAAYPEDWKRMLVFEKPIVGAGLIGVRVPWLSNWEPIFMMGEWPDQTPKLSAVVKTRAAAASGYSGYTTKAGHPHAKPLDVMEALISATPSGTIADPFAGSGTTVEACILENLHCIAIELEAEYLPLIQARINRQDAA